MFAVVLISLTSMETNAQDANVSCPCFSYEEVESIFQSGEQLTVWDQNYEIIAQARVDWFDFDPSRCDYIDTVGNPGVERNVKWPHPAPEATAKSCFNIISSVIAKSDTSGRCNTYP